MPGPAPLSAVTGLPVVAMVGGGQLSRMTHQAAVALGQSLRVLATDPDESAALVTADVQIGDHRSLADLQRLADGATVVTFDHEHVPTEHLHALEDAGHQWLALVASLTVGIAYARVVRPVHQAVGRAVLRAR